tara:strand:- start:12543 stop:13397 length:855 start_codon:yes stop_codon:yes gene_type:complete
MTFNNLFTVTSKEELLSRLELILKYTIALCFIGHGFWGIVSKPEWVSLITPLGFSKEFALASLPYIGWIDVVLAVCIFANNNKTWLWKAFLWTVFTALLRPIAGMSFFEVAERAGNWGPPLAFLLLAYALCPKKKIFSKLSLSKPENFGRLTPELIDAVKLTLQISIGLLLIGHGGLVAITQKSLYADHLAVLGITATSAVLSAYGFFEIILGIVVALRPSRSLLWFVLVWKIFTESLFPFAGSLVDIFETIERFGDFGAPIALILILSYLEHIKSSHLSRSYV